MYTSISFLWLLTLSLASVLSSMFKFLTFRLQANHFPFRNDTVKTFFFHRALFAFICKYWHECCCSTFVCGSLFCVSEVDIYSVRVIFDLDGGVMYQEFQLFGHGSEGSVWTSIFAPFFVFSLFFFFCLCLHARTLSPWTCCVQCSESVNSARLLVEQSSYSSLQENRTDIQL